MGLGDNTYDFSKYSVKDPFGILNLNQNTTTNLDDGFDANAGREKAYNERWKNYLGELTANSNNNVNLKKARSYFDSQFDNDWAAGERARREQYIKQRTPTQYYPLTNEDYTLAQQMENNSLEKEKYFNFNNQGQWEAKNQVVNGQWNQNAQNMGASPEQVRAIQQQLNRLGYLGTNGHKLLEDGKWGANTQKAYQDYINKTGNLMDFDQAVASYVKPKIKIKPKIDFNSGSTLKAQEDFVSFKPTDSNDTSEQLPSSFQNYFMSNSQNSPSSYYLRGNTWSPSHSETATPSESKKQEDTENIADQNGWDWKFRLDTGRLWQ